MPMGWQGAIPRAGLQVSISVPRIDVNSSAYYRMANTRGSSSIFTSVVVYHRVNFLQRRHGRYADNSAFQSGLNQGVTIWREQEKAHLVFRTVKREHLQTGESVPEFNLGAVAARHHSPPVWREC